MSILTAFCRVALKWAASLKNEGVPVASVHPGKDILYCFVKYVRELPPSGWVDTEIGEPIKEWMTKNAPDVPQIKPEESGAAVVKVAEELSLVNTGTFFNYTGESLPR